MLGMMVAIPIIIFPLNTSVEDAQFKLAVELYKKGQYTDAIVEFDRLLVDMHSKKYADACYFYRGYAYLGMNEYEKARDEFVYVVDSIPDSSYFSRSLYQFGRAEYLLGNYKNAIYVFDTYVARFPSLDYADNSLYWKGESLLGLGERDGAREMFQEVLHAYPTGNKADAARFKLRLMEIEDELAAREEVPPVEEIIPEGATPEEIAQWRAKEEQYRSEVDRLNEQIELLRTEIDTLKELGELAESEREVQIEERMKALIAWENILKIKEETLTQKELQLDRQFERMQQISAEFERIENE